jgi:hypothetical protein
MSPARVPAPPEPDQSKCPKCGKFGVSYDHAAKAFICLWCRWRDR